MFFDQQKQLKNYFVLEFVLFGSLFNEFIKPFIAEMKHFKKGRIIDIQDNKSLVIASIENTTSNLLQDNDLVEVKRHNATRGYSKQFEKISSVSTITKCKKISAQYGLHLYPPILSKLLWESHLQSSHDVYHATSSKVLRLFKITVEALSTEGQSAFITIWKSFEYPKNWSKIPNPCLKSNWFVFEKPNNIKNDTNEDKYIKILLKKRILQKNIEESILLDLKVQLELFYEDLGYSYPVWNNSLLFFEYASFLIEENDTSIQCYLHIGDIVLINSDKEEESFSIICSIFCVQKDEYNTIFIIINWLENTNQTKLDCPIYRLHTTNKWQRVFPIGVVNAVNT
ncbi:36058_t:CDS:2, partial [Racocetra persica]